MAKHRFQPTRNVRAAGFLLLAMLVMAWGMSLGWAADQSSKSSPSKAGTAVPAAGQKKGSAAAARSAKAPAERRNTTLNFKDFPAAEGKRDPFKLPPEPVPGRGGPEEYAPSGVLPPGVRGLLISQLKLEGVVRENTDHKMIAVVTNATKRAYFLTENESVYNGVVSKITPDAVYFTENVLDENGRVTSREVVKRLNSAPGEGR